jgi:hypothetical protein
VWVCFRVIRKIYDVKVKHCLCKTFRRTGPPSAITPNKSSGVPKTSRIRWSSEKFKDQVKFRKIQGSGGVQKNSRIRSKSEKFKAQVEFRKIQGSGGPNSSSFRHHPKQLLLSPSPQTAPPSKGHRPK